MASPEDRAALREVRPEARRLVVFFVHHDGVTGAVPRILLCVRQFDAAADRFLFDRADREVRGQEPPLALSVVGDGGGKTEQLLVDTEMDRRLVVRGGYQDRLLRGDAD